MSKENLLERPTRESGPSSRNSIDLPSDSDAGPRTKPTGVSASIILPTYNESANVNHVVERCLASLGAHEFEIIVVDDDSPDGTWRIAREGFADEDRVRVVRRRHERGLSTAVSRGLDEAQHEVCLILDADLQHPPEKIPELLRAFEEGADLVIASRHTEGGGIENWSAFRTAVSHGATAIARLCVPSAREVTDPLSGFFAVRHDVVHDVDLQPTGYKILLEILARGHYDTVAEVPYMFVERERGESKLSTAEYLNFLVHVGTLRARSLGR